MLKIVKTVREFLKMDRILNEAREEETRRGLILIAAVAALGFIIMSVPNVMQQSYAMLATTAGSAVLFLLGLLLTLISKSTTPVKIATYIVLIVIFPVYTYWGGNDGFACMWIVIVSHLVMHYIDFKMGFLIDLFYLVMLIVLFWVGIPGFKESAYGETFLLRFPLFYAINFICAVVLVVSVKKYQYKLLVAQRKYADLSIRDLNMGIYNRNGYIEFTEKFDGDVESLAYVYIDANGLHEVNNTKGHAEGDRFLKAVADACKTHFPTDYIYRLGGDEFLVICKNMKEQEVVDMMEAADKDLWSNNWVCSFGYDYRTENIDLNQMLKISNQRMLDDKAEYYSQPEHDRRMREINVIRYA